MKLAAKYMYPLLSRQLATDDVVFLNVGYEEDPPMNVPLELPDEPYRAPIQLYHRTASQVDVTNRRVLEVGCGHGGGASYVTRYLRPASYTAIDLNAAGIAFCQRKHALPGLRFMEGDAQALRFPDGSFDVVINVESSHCYADFAGFLAEVARVLTPGGSFVYADLRNRSQVAQWESDIAASPLTLLTKNVINTEVVQGLDKLWSTPQMSERFNRQVPRLLRGVAKAVVGVPGPGLYRALQGGKISYRMYSFTKS